MKFIDSVKEAQMHLEHLGLSDIVLPKSESQDSKYFSYAIVTHGKINKQYILVVPCNLDKIIETDSRDHKIAESKVGTAKRALFKETGVTANESDLEEILLEGDSSSYRGEHHHYIYVVKSFFGNEFKVHPSDPNRGDPFFFPVEKLNKILIDDQKWITYKIRKFLEKKP